MKKAIEKKTAKEILIEFAKNLLSNQKQLESCFVKIIDENFEDLLKA
jgi:hypothetical protein